MFYALRQAAIDEQRDSYKRATNGFTVGTYQQLIPEADVVYNLTPDKQHASVVEAVMPLMKEGATLGYSHGFNIVEEGQQIRSDITVIMCAPKSPGSEVREEYKRGFGVPTLIAVHPENDPEGKGWDQAKALAVQRAVTAQVYLSHHLWLKLNLTSWASKPFCVVCNKLQRYLRLKKWLMTVLTQDTQVHLFSTA